MNLLTELFRPSARRAAGLAAAAGLLIALPSLAQSAPQGAFDKPLTTSAAPRARAAHAAGDSSTVMSVADGDHTYTIKVHNNEISADIDGKPVPPDRIDRKGDTIILKDEHGKTLKTFDISPKGVKFHEFSGAAGAQGGGLGGGASGQPQGAWTLSAEPPNPPPVMVGITMSDADSSVLEHLGLDEGSAFVIDRVVDDLPGDKAGLKPHDLVVAIDGQKPATQDKFREIMRDRKPGDSLELTIVRKGREQKVKVELAAYDRSKLTVGVPGGALAPSAPQAQSQGPRDATTYWWNVAPRAHASDEVRKQIEEALKSVRDTDHIKSDDLRKHVEEALNNALKALEQSRSLTADRYRLLTDPANRDALILGTQPDQVFAVPSDRDAGRDMNRHMERLSEQLEKLNKRLEDLERRLNEKK